MSNKKTQNLTCWYAWKIMSNKKAWGISLALYLARSNEWSKHPSAAEAITVETKGRIAPAAYRTKHKET